MFSADQSLPGTQSEIYLDNNATTPPLPSVIEAMVEVMAQRWGNASSPHGRGRAARRLIDGSRDKAAEFFCVPASGLVFTSGATEANDAVLKEAFLDSGTRLITTAAEHPSLYGAYATSKERLRLIPVDRQGLIDLDCLEAVLKEGPALVALSWANGETGVLQPIQQVEARIKAAGQRLLVDATQAAGRISRSEFEGIHPDFLTASAHKMNGPQGVGCLILGENVPCPPMAAGGGQEDGRRSGTENLPGIVGFGVACSERTRTLDADLIRMTAIRDHFEGILLERLPGAWINGLNAPRVVTSTSLTISGVDGMALAARCDAAGVRCSQVSACSGARPEPSRTLLAMGLAEKDAFASLRFSVSVINTISEIESAAEIIVQEALALRRLMGEFA